MIMLLAMSIVMVVIVLCSFHFTRTSKEMPKSWFELRTELRYQHQGVVGLIHDYMKRSSDHVGLYKQPGRVAVITGGNRGIGLRIVEKLLACDMTVIMGVRDPILAEEAVRDIVDVKKSGGRLLCETLDIGDLTSVREFVARIREKTEKVDILINNAGIMFAPFRMTADGFESHFATNHLGHVLLTHLLLPLMRVAAASSGNRNARIVNVSSCVNVIGKINYDDINGIKRYYPATAYSQSKLAQILFTRHLQRVLDAEGACVQVNAVHPGIVDTDLFEHSATTSVPLFKKILFKTPEQGARCVVYAAIDPKVEGHGGQYYSNCEEGSAHADADSDAKCSQLFDYSCELLKIESFGKETR